MKTVAEFLVKENPGFFVDIGAYDGIDNDETIILERNGWTGLCIEGNPSIYNRLKANRKLTYNAFVGERNKEEEVLLMSPSFMGSGIISNFPQHHLENLHRMDRSGKTTKFVTEHLEDILDKFVFPKYIKLLKSDTEGNCLNILKTLSFERYVFQYIAVELGNDSEGTFSRGVEFLKIKNYEFVRKIGQNDIFKLKELVK